MEIDEKNVPFIQLGAHQFRIDREDLDEVYKNRARDELRETPEVVEAALRQLREYIINEPSLHVPLDEDKFLIKYLRPCKFYPESAFRLIKNYYKFNQKHPKIALNITLNDVRHVFDNEVLVCLPTKTPTGSRIMVINAGTKWKPKVVSVYDLFKAMVVAVELALLEPKSQVAGVHVIFNMAGFSWTHFYQFSPRVAMNMAEWVQECVPIRLKGIHVINQSIFVNMLYAIFKPLLGAKLRERLHFHGSNRTSLGEQLSVEALPKSLGGIEPLLDYPGTLFSEVLSHYEDIFETHNSYGYSSEKSLSKSHQ